LRSAVSVARLTAASMGGLASACRALAMNCPASLCMADSFRQAVGQHLGDVPHLAERALARQPAVHVHHATDVAGDDGWRFAGADVGELLFQHRRAKLWHLDAEQPAEPATFVVRSEEHTSELQSRE